MFVDGYCDVKFECISDEASDGRGCVVYVWWRAMFSCVGLRVAMSWR